MSSPSQVSRMRAAVRRVKAGGERFLGGVLPGASARRLQVKAFADDWAAANLDARQATGPLWVVLGDSASQGIGATRRETGYVSVVHERLRRRDAWRVINLSRAGAGVTDVLTRQLPELVALTSEDSAALVSCIVGAEDITRRVPGVDVLLRQVLASLPSGAVVATFARGSRGGPAAALDAVTREEAARHRLRIAELPPRFGPGGKGRGANLLGDVEHAGWAEAVLAAIDGPPAEIAPSTDPELPVVPAVDAKPAVDPKSTVDRMPAADAETAPVTDPELPVVPAVDAKPAVDPKPAADRMPAADAEPAAERKPAVDPMPVGDAKLGADQKSAVDPKPALDPMPVADGEPAAGGKPAVDPVSAVGAKPAVDPEPAADRMPAADAEPAAERRPAVDPMPVGDAKLGADQKSAVDSKPVADGKPAADPVSAVDANARADPKPAAGPKPAADLMSAAEARLAADPEPAADRMPTADAEPSADRRPADAEPADD